LIAIGSGSGFVQLFDGASGAALATLGKPGLAYRAMAFSPDGNLLAAGRDDASVSLWNIEREQPLWTVAGAPAGIVSAARSGARIFTGHIDGSVTAHDAGTPPFAGHDRFVYTMDADAQRVVSGAFRWACRRQ
jgi:WD40 repeat protein